ncbi:MAG: glycoside hydrolase family 13 protein, partial [Ruminococcus sp.]|nr:glycoside hydrolase family 13 protein [Ruminococcus sp.]
LDSVMNYPFREAIINYVKGGNVKDFIYSVMTIIENYPKPTVDVLMNFVSTHDIERAINRLGGENCDDKSKDWMAEKYLNEHQYNQGKNLLKAAMALMFFLPGVPSIYYGDEAGLQGYKDPFNRRCYPWGNEDKELIEFVSELSRVRKSIPNMKYGRTYFTLNDNEIVDERVISFTRQGDTDAIVFVNRSGDDIVLENIDKLMPRFKDFDKMYGEFENNSVTIKPYGYTIISAKFTG